MFPLLTSFSAALAYVKVNRHNFKRAKNMELAQLIEQLRDSGNLAQLRAEAIALQLPLLTARQAESLRLFLLKKYRAALVMVENPVQLRQLREKTQKEFEQCVLSVCVANYQKKDVFQEG
jgi:hypothetical protein